MSNSELSLPQELSGVHIHFVGIKGTGMAALVEILFHKGAVITGSDVSERFYTDEILEKLGLNALPFGAENITDDIQYVIYSSAYKPDKNPDLIEAARRGIPCLLYTQALGSYSSRAYSCGICGVHGKTSTTGLTGTILKEIDLPSQILAGSIINSFGNTCTYTSPLVKENAAVEGGADDGAGTLSMAGKAGNFADGSVLSGSNIFVAETCEYQRHFMSFCPQKIILTSVEPDHQDYYPTYEDIRSAFIDYICKLPSGGDVIYCADDKGACDAVLIAKQKRADLNLIPYGESATGDFKLFVKGVKNEKNRFSLALFSDFSDGHSGSDSKADSECDFALCMPGHHEVLDAAAAVALVCQLLRTFGKNPLDYADNISRGLLSFTGGKRRSEIIGRFTTKSGNDVIVIDDYGHHPTAIKTTLAGFRDFYKGRKIIVDFMSHTYSRTLALLDEFAKSFTSADTVILHKIYASARENIADFNITGRTLFEKAKENHSEVYYFEEILDAKDFVLSELEKNPGEKYPDGYVFVTMGAGDNWRLGRAVLG